MNSCCFMGFETRLGALLLVFILCLPLVIPAEGGTSVVMTFTGDCTLGSEDRLASREDSFVGYVKRYGFEYPFAKMKDFFEEDDLTVINLENVFFDRTTSKANKRYLFRAPTSFAQILKEGSVELAFIANNHILDYGKNGLLSTISAVEALDIGVFGSNHTVSLGYIYEKNGIKIGFLGTYQAYWYVGRDALSKLLNSFREAGCHAVVGIIHDGTEYARNRNKKQQQMADWLVKQGVDLVVGHHPHVPQGVDILGGATVLYSLGNFSFGGNRLLDITRRPGVRADKAIIARVEMRFDAQKNYLGHQVNLIPISPSGSSEYNNYQPVFLTGEEALAAMELVQYDTGFTLAPYQEGIGALQPFVPAQDVENPQP